MYIFVIKVFMYLSHIIQHLTVWQMITSLFQYTPLSFCSCFHFFIFVILFNQSKLESLFYVHANLMLRFLNLSLNEVATIFSNHHENRNKMHSAQLPFAHLKPIYILIGIIVSSSFTFLLSFVKFWFYQSE